MKSVVQDLTSAGSSDTDSFMEELKELAKGDDRILFTGFVQGAMLDELYSNAYIYTLPSDLEGMPLSLLEAMSYGNCCLVSDIPECTEVVEDKALISRIRRTDTAIVRSHFFPAAYAGSPCPRPLYAGYESERYCRNGGYHTITGGKIHPRCTAEAAPVLCASEMDGQSISVSKEKRCMT